MPIIEKHKIIFQHVPKTAGLSVCDFFEIDGDGHHHLIHYFNQLGPDDFSQYTTLSIVRDPIDRFVSAWNMYKDPPEYQKDNKLLYKVRERYSELFDLDINEFITLENLHQLCSDQDAFHFWPIMCFYCTYGSKNGKNESFLFDTAVNNIQDVTIVAPKIILNFDSLENDFKLLSEFYGFEFDKLPRRNHSKPYKTGLTQESYLLLKSYFRFDSMLIDGFLKQIHISKIIERGNQ